MNSRTRVPRVIADAEPATSDVAGSRVPWRNATALRAGAEPRGAAEPHCAAEPRGAAELHGAFTYRRAQNGSAMPIIVFSLAAFVAFIALTADVMRVLYTANVLNFGAQAAALAGLSYATKADGSYNATDAQNNIVAAVQKAGGFGSTAAWHRAPVGPDSQSGTYDSPVQFASGDITFPGNPADGTEFFLRVRARRDGSDALRLVFLPLIYAYNAMLGLPMPPGIETASPYRVAEVIAQPATRIGRGAPRDAASGTRAAELSGFSTFPIAISNQQFVTAADPAAAINTYTIDLPQSNQPTPPLQPGHMRGCFVNVTYAGGADYYGTGQGNLAIDQLNHSLQYFHNGFVAQAIPPAVVERGSRLFAFDPADPVFQSRKGDVLAQARLIPAGSYCIVPVIRNDPSFSQTNEVVGFARLRLRSLTDFSGTAFNISFDITESVPVRNASFANGVAAVPTFGSNVLPPPVPPFIERRHLPQSDGIEPRSRSIVMAPALSPRAIPKI